MWECSECECENDLDPDIEEGQVVVCGECGLEYEVLGTDPLDLAPVDDEEVTADVEESESETEEEWED